MKDLKDMYNFIENEVKRVVKETIEALALEERRIYLDEHPETKGNGFYTRSFITKFGALDNLKVPRVREGDFRPKILPEKRRASLDLGEVILGLFASGSSVRDVSRFMETIYGVYYSPASISRLIEVTTQEIDRWRNREVEEEYFALYVDATFLSVRRGSVSKEPGHLSRELCLLIKSLYKHLPQFV